MNTFLYMGCPLLDPPLSHYLIYCDLCYAIWNEKNNSLCMPILVVDMSSIQGYHLVPKLPCVVNGGNYFLLAM